jgi:hypothetical protein
MIIKMENSDVEMKDSDMKMEDSNYNKNYWFELIKLLNI